MLALGSHLRVQCRLVERVLCRLLHAALVLGHIVELVATEGEVRLGAANPCENFISVLLPLADLLSVLFFGLVLSVTFLGRRPWDVVVLSGQIRPSKLVNEGEAFFLGRGVVRGPEVFVVLACLGLPVESV